MLVLVDPDVGDAFSDMRDGPEQHLARAGKGDRQAFAELYDETSRRVFGLIRRLLVDSAQAEEVTQEVYLEVWQTASRYSPERGSAISWLLTMAHRRAVDRVRASQASRDRDSKIGIRDYDREYDHVAEHVEVRMESDRVKVALANLTELQRQAIELAYFGGLSHSEIAATLHVPVGTIKTRIRDGMIRLRDALGVTS